MPAGDVEWIKWKYTRWLAKQNLSPAKRLEYQREPRFGISKFKRSPEFAIWLARSKKKEKTVVARAKREFAQQQREQKKKAQEREKQARALQRAQAPKRPAPKKICGLKPQPGKIIVRAHYRSNVRKKKALE